MAEPYSTRSDPDNYQIDPLSPTDDQNYGIMPAPSVLPMATSKKHSPPTSDCYPITDNDNSIQPPVIGEWLQRKGSSTYQSYQSASLLPNGGQDTPAPQSLIDSTQLNPPALREPDREQQPLIEPHHQDRRKCGGRQCVILIGIILFVLLIAFLLGLPVPVVYALKDNTTYRLRTTFVEGRNGVYGVYEDLVNPYVHNKVELEGFDGAEATLILAKELYIDTANEPINPPRLASGPPFSELYSYGNFSFIANITGDIGFNFTFEIDRIDEQGKMNTVCYNATTIKNNTNGVKLNCSSRESGYYNASVRVWSNDKNANISIILKYNEITVKKYNNTNSLQCDISENTNVCSVSVEHDYTNVIVHLATQSENTLIIKWYTNKSILLAVPLPIAGVIIGVLVVLLIIVCLALKYKMKRPIGVAPTEEHHQNNDLSVETEYSHEIVEGQ